MEKQAEYNIRVTADQLQEFVEKNPRASEELLTMASQNMQAQVKTGWEHYANMLRPSYRELVKNEGQILDAAVGAREALRKQQLAAKVAEVEQPMPVRGLTEPEKAMLEHLDNPQRTHGLDQVANVVDVKRSLHRDAKVHADDFAQVKSDLLDRGSIRYVGEQVRESLQITDKGRTALENDRRNDIPHKLRTTPLNQRELAVLMAMPDKGSGIGITDLTKASARKAEKLGFEHIGENTVSIAEELKKTGLVGAQGLQYFRSPFGDAYLQKIQNQQLKPRHADIERSR